MCLMFGKCVHVNRIPELRFLLQINRFVRKVHRFEVFAYYKVNSCLIIYTFRFSKEKVSVLCNRARELDCGLINPNRVLFWQNMHHILFLTPFCIDLIWFSLTMKSPTKFIKKKQFHSALRFTIMSKK